MESAEDKNSFAVGCENENYALIDKADVLKIQKATEDSGKDYNRLLEHHATEFLKSSKTEQYIQLGDGKDLPKIVILLKRNQEANEKARKIDPQEKNKHNEPEDFFTKNNKGKIQQFVPQRMGDYLMQENFFKIIEGNDKQIYVYENGFYKENGAAFIGKRVVECLDYLYKSHYLNEVLSYITNTNYIKAEAVNHNWTNLKNGLYNPLTKEFREHTPDIFCLHQLPIDYDSQADCPFFIKTLKEKCDEEWKYDVVQEMFGYCNLHDNRYEKAFLFYGLPRTMKSTLLYVLIKMLGENNITAYSLQSLTEDKFAAAGLFGVAANICADLSTKELHNTAMFMKIIGQDKITAGMKFEQEKTFWPYSKLIFSCNVIPATHNKNDAFYRRWIILEFNKQTPENEIDSLMREKFMKELSGIFNWSLEGLDRILRNQKLSYPLSVAAVKDLYERGSDSISSFIYSKIDSEDDANAIKKREVYKKYLVYCKENLLQADNQIRFGRRFYEITGCGSKKIDGIPAYAGVSFKSEKIQEVLQ